MSDVKTDGMVFFSNDDMTENIKKVIMFTNYTEEEATEKLKQYNCDYMLVIREYMGINKKKEEKIGSVNQEIFKQIRHKLDKSMETYRQKNPININQVISNFQESEHNQIQNEKKL
jgi:hypothetical protein